MTELLTPHQAAERLQISERTLMEHVKAQNLTQSISGRVGCVGAFASILPTSRRSSYARRPGRAN